MDVFFWFDKSSKRKNLLREYCCFCDIEYQNIVKHVSTRWLSLQRAVERVLKQFNSLRSYFLSESCSEARFARLSTTFSNPMTEVYLLFFQSVLHLFDCFNLLLQREDPCIHLVYDQCESLLKKLLGRLVSSAAIDTASSLFDIDHNSEQLSDSDIFVGFTTKQKLLSMESNGDCSPIQRKKFYYGVRSFYTSAISYIKQKFPFQDELLKHARFVNFENRTVCSFADVEYFVQRYLTVPALSTDLYDEFVSYQLLKKEDIPSLVWESALVTPESDALPYTRIDTIWGHLAALKTGDGCNLKFPQLSLIAKLVLTIPHSNAGEEHVFSLVRLNKTRVWLWMGHCPAF